MEFIIYILGTVSTGLFAGLMMTLVFLLQRQWNRQNRAEYAAYFKQFLQIAKGNPLITALTFVSFIAPCALSVMSFQGDQPVGGYIYAIASAVFFIGCFVVTVFLNLPIYNKVIAWQKESDSADWQDIRNRFFVLNVIRFSSALIAFILLVVGRILG